MSLLNKYLIKLPQQHSSKRCRPDTTRRRLRTRLFHFLIFCCFQAARGLRSLGREFDKKTEKNIGVNLALLLVVQAILLTLINSKVKIVMTLQLIIYSLEFLQALDAATRNA